MNLVDQIDEREVARINLDENYSFDWCTLLLGLLATLIIFSLPLFAGDSNNDIMYVIDSPILRGRNDMVSKYSTGIAWLAQLIITACGFFIICLKTVGIAFTILYLTHPDLWQKVHEMKENWKNQANGDGSWFYTILAWCTPDVMALSDYGKSDDQSMYNDGGIQTVGQYIKTNAIQFIALVTLASVLWSGKLLKLVGSISEGCVAVFDWALSIDYGGKVTDLLEADRDYQFLYNTSTTAGNNMQKVAQMIYSQVKTAVPDNRTSSFLNAVGKNIDDMVGEWTGSYEKGKLPLASKLTGYDSLPEDSYGHITWDNPTLTCTLTWNSDAPDEQKKYTIPTVKGGVYVIPLKLIIPKSSSDGVTTTQTDMYDNGVLYLSFQANQTYNKTEQISGNSK